MNDCIRCGAKLTGEPHCANCGATAPTAVTPATFVTGESVKNPISRPAATSTPRRGRTIAIVGSVALVGLTAAAIIAVVNPETQTQSVETAVASTSSPSVTAAVPSPVSTAEEPSRTSPPSPESQSLATAPQQALKLTSSEARAQLKEHRELDRDSLDSVLYSWAPQVSSKCEGLDNVDLKPAWFPDGRAETNNLTVQQILAFHLSLANRDGALLITDRDVGDRTVFSGCSGRTMWMALIPKSFRSATAANRWCDRNGYPVGECAARYVVDAGESGAKVKWRT